MMIRPPWRRHILINGAIIVRVWAAEAFQAVISSAVAVPARLRSLISCKRRYVNPAGGFGFKPAIGRSCSG